MTSGSGLRRVLGPLDATCVVVGAIIGVGIFFTPAEVARLAGSAGVALTAWAVGGVIAMLGALTFAELGGLYPRSGGQYEVLRDAWGPRAGFLYVFCNATAIQSGAIAIIALICADHLALAASGVHPAAPAQVGLALLLILGLAGANVLGVRFGAGIQNATVFARVTTLLAVTALAMTVPAAPEAAAAAEAELGLAGVLAAALVPAFFAFGGWQHALWIAGEVRRPQRNVPLAIVVGVGVVVATYMAVNWAYLHLLGAAGVAAAGPTLAADAVARAWPGAGARTVAGAVALSAFGVLNAQLLSGPRLIHGMALDGRFFATFARANTSFGTPVAAILLLAGIAIVVLLANAGGDIAVLLTGVVFVDGVFFALTGAALFALRRRRPDAERPVRVPCYPLVPALFVLGEAAGVTGAVLSPRGWIGAVVGCGWIAAAAACYALFFARPVGARP